MAEREIARNLECPGCFDYMFGFIYICSAGHSICKNCKVTIRSCPTCRSPFNAKRRNYSLEHISVLLSYPCPYEVNGCPEIVNYSDLKEHKKTCPFRPYLCIVSNDCDYEGPRDALENHYRQKHPVSSWMAEDNEDRWDQSSPKRETQVAFCHNEMFYFHRILENSSMYWVCQFVGKSEDATNFSYTLTFDNGEGSAIYYKYRCVSDLLAIPDIIETGRCVGMEKRMLETFIEIDRMVSYRVTIQKNS